MFKVVLLLHRRADLSEPAFADAWIDLWREAPAPLELLRHLHNRPLAGDMPIENVSTAAFDAMDEFWFRDAAGAGRFFADHAAQGSASPLARLSRPPYAAVAAEPTLAWRGQAAVDDRPVKVVTLPVRRPGLDWEAFYKHWTQRHWPLALNAPGATEGLRYVDMCGRREPPSPGLAAAPFDGVGTIVFASLEVMEQQFAGAYYRDVLAPDELRFTDPVRSRGLLVRETPILDRFQD